MRCRKFEGNLAEASAKARAVHAARGLGAFFFIFFIFLFFKLAEAAASAASMQFTALSQCLRLSPNAPPPPLDPPLLSVPCDQNLSSCTRTTLGIPGWAMTSH